MKYAFGLVAFFLGLMAIQSTPANDEFIAQCEAYAAEFNADIDCECLDKAAQEDPSLYEEFAKVQKPEDAALMSEAAQEVVAMCSAE